MKIQILQYDVQWMDATGNIDTIERILEKSSNSADLVVLPEMFLSGFNMDAKVASIDEQGKEIKALVRIAKRYSTCLIGSLAISVEGEFYNRVLLISEEGIIGRYDKRFRFSPSGESEAYSQKYTANLIDFHGLRVLPQVCYDLRFPESIREGETPDLVIYMANWPSPRIAHWDTLLRARAIENQCFVIGCNRLGTDDNGWEFPGHSQAVRYDGEVNIINSDSEILSVELDHGELIAYRERYPFLKDRIL